MWDRLTGRPVALDPEDLGVIAVQLALNFPYWVRRRRFIINYVDDATIQQRMSVDFTLPPPDWFWSTIPPRVGDTVYVPIYLPAKDTLDQFTVHDEDGRRLTMLPTSDNGALAIAGLLPLVRGLAFERLANDGRREAVLAELQTEIAKVVMAPKRPGSPDAAAVMAAALAGPLGDVLRPGDLPTTMLQDLAAGFLMLVPVAYRPGVDRLLKAEWDVPAYWIGGQGVRRHVQSWLAAISWADKRQIIPSLQIGYARSTHVEVAAPEGVEMTAVSLEAEQYDADHPTHGPVTTARTVFNKPRATINIAPRVRFSPLDPDGARREHATQALLQARGDEARVEIRFRSPASGVLVAATTASGMLAVLIWVASAHLASLDRQTFSAVLLVFPAILAAYLLRPDEHAFARRLLTGVRLCGLGVAVCSVVVSALLGVAALTEPRTRSVEASPGAEQITCSLRGGSVDLDAQRVRLPRSARCSVGAPAGAQLQANRSTRTWIERIAKVASGLTAVMVFGWLRTWLWSGLRNRRRAEKYEERVSP